MILAWIVVVACLVTMLALLAYLVWAVFDMALWAIRGGENKPPAKPNLPNQAWLHETHGGPTTEIQRGRVER